MFQNKHCNIFYFDSFALQQKKWKEQKPETDKEKRKRKQIKVINAERNKSSQRQVWKELKDYDGNADKETEVCKVDQFRQNEDKLF